MVHDQDRLKLRNDVDPHQEKAQEIGDDENHFLLPQNYLTSIRFTGLPNLELFTKPGIPAATSTKDVLIAHVLAK